jgi:hypothetical protein
MKELPRLELTEDPNKKNDYIIFRHSIKGKTKKTSTKKRLDKKVRSKRYRNGKTKKSKNGRTSKKGFLNIFYN